MSERAHLVVAGVCVRYLTAAARRAAYWPIAVDGFGDLDTLAAATRLVTVRRASADALAESALTIAGERGRGCRMVYSGGFEGRPDLLERLSRHFDLLGNPPSTIAVLGDPHRFFALMGRLDIPTPEVRYRVPPTSEGWLLKHAGSCGGMAVYPAAAADRRALAPDAYFQRRVPGAVVSALFAADGRESVVIGFNRLVSRPLGDRSFCYGGAITHAPLDADHRACIQDYAGRLTRALQLRGINGIDLVLDGDTPLLLELNPRPTATLELYDRGLPGGGLAAHVAACEGRLPVVCPNPGGLVRGCRVLYAPYPLQVPALRWPGWCRDRPVPGSRIASGAPICTLYAQGKAHAEVVSILKIRATALLKLLVDLDRKAA